MPNDRSPASAELAHAIEQRRKKLGVPKSELATLLGVSRQTLYRYLRGEFLTVDDAAVMAERLGTSLQEILAG